MSSGQYLRIQTKGRKSGRPHQVLVRYIVENNRIVAFPQNSGKQDWVKNIESNPEIKIYYDNSITTAEGKLRQISGLNDQLLPIFSRKYGASTVDRWYKGQHTYVEMLLEERSGQLTYDEIIYGDLEAAFDSVAENYDHHIFDNPINTWLRNVSIGTMVELFKPGETVLEIGCGTGTETLSLAGRGVRVIAADISGKMLEVLSHKARVAGLSDLVVPLKCRPTQLKAEIQKLSLDSLDGAYSTYGAVNTEPNLAQMMKDIHFLLRPGSRLLLGVWNKFCIYEIFGYSLRANPALAFARLKNPVPIGKSRFCVSSNAFSVGSISKILRGYFKLEKVQGVVVLLPPSNLTRYLPRGRFCDFLKKIDLNLGAAFPANRLGDHFLAVYKRV